MSLIQLIISNFNAIKFKYIMYMYTIYVYVYVYVCEFAVKRFFIIIKKHLQFYRDLKLFAIVLKSHNNRTHMIAQN